MTSDSKFSLFLEAQEGSYEIAHLELTNGQKRSHWMWFMFPQLQGLGFSATSKRYAIENLNQAKEYLAHPLLGARLIELTMVFEAIEGKSAQDILGSPDDLKMRSSMTLFSLCTNNNSVFDRVLDKYFGGQQCLYTKQCCQVS